MNLTEGLPPAADRLARLLGIADKPLDAARIVAKARRIAGLDDFGDEDVSDALGRYLAACSRQSELNILGRMATSWDAACLLANLLRMRASEQADPSILSREIEKPIFVMGLQRSGATLLRRLMLTDAANRAPKVWETMHPVPETIDAVDFRPARAARMLRAFARMAPDAAGASAPDADSPQECSEITAHVFRSARFDTNCHIPAYRAWLDGDRAAHAPAYRFHKRFLRHLSKPEAAGRRWLLNCPEHVYALNALREAYPDARIVFVHRDPVPSLPKVARATAALRRPFSANIDPIEIARQERNRWLDGAERMIAAADAEPFAEPICHVHYLDLLSDPRATVEGVYRHFGMELPGATGQAIDGLRVRRRTDAPTFREFGLNEAREREAFQRYATRFGIASEGAQLPFAAAPRERVTA
jgi:hypothetical protein